MMNAYPSLNGAATCMKRPLKRRSMDKTIKLFASGMGLGYLPKAPGTFGTLLGIPLFWGLDGLPLAHYIIFLAVFIIFSSWIADKAKVLFGEDDPKRVTIDEVAGVFVAVGGHPF